MIRVLIVKNIVQLKSIPRLVTYLKDNPFVCDLCGFDSYRIPDETQFYRLLHSLDNDTGCTLVEIPVPINLTDNEIPKILFKELKINYDLSELRNIFGDKAYDDKKMKCHIHDLLKPSLKRPQDLEFIIRKNCRNSKCPTPAIEGIPCPGNLMMRFNGLTPVNKKGTKYRMKFCFPLAVLNLD